MFVFFLKLFIFLLTALFIELICSQEHNLKDIAMKNILSTKYARSLIAQGKAEREYKPLACVTKQRELDKLYAVLHRVDKDGNHRFDHYIA